MKEAILRDPGQPKTENKFKDELKEIHRKTQTSAADMKRLTQIISSCDSLFIFSHFTTIKKIVKPLIDSWKRRTKVSVLNNRVGYFFIRLNQRLSKFQSKLNIILPEYLKLKSYFEKETKIRIKSQASTSYADTGEEGKNVIEEYLEKLFTREDMKNLPKINQNRLNKCLTNLQNKIKEKAYRDRLPAEKINFEASVIKKLMEKSFENRQCLVCTKNFYYANEFTFDTNVSYYEVDTFSSGKTSKTLSLSENQIKGLVCSFLNSDRGGVILGGCQKVGTSVVSYGCELTEKEKDAQQQRIEKYLQSFQPRITRNIDFFIDFVPVYSSPFDAGPENHKTGLYVIRIFVVPKEPHYTYFYTVGSSTMTNSESFIEIRRNGESINLRGEEIYEYMKERVKIFSVQKEFPVDYQLQDFLKKRKIHHCHYKKKCDDPDQGNKLYEQPAPVVENQVKPEVSEPIKNQNQNIENVSPERMGDETKEFKNISILVAQQKMKRKLENALENETATKLKRWKIEKRFQYSNFYMIPHTWLIYHDDKFEVIKKKIDKNKITFKGKHAHLISTTKNVEIDVLPEEGINWIGNWVFQILVYEKLYKEGDNVFSGTSTQQEEKGKKTVLSFTEKLGAIYVYLWYDNDKKPVKFIRNSKIQKNQEEGQEEN